MTRHRRLHGARRHHHDGDRDPWCTGSRSSLSSISTPSLPRDVTSVVDEYIRAAHAAGLRDLRIIHGRGHGVQRSSSRSRSIAIPSSPSSGTTPTRILGRRIVVWSVEDSTGSGVPRFRGSGVRVPAGSQLVSAARGFEPRAIARVPARPALPWSQRWHPPCPSLTRARPVFPANRLVKIAVSAIRARVGDGK